MRGERYSERSESISADFETAFIDPVEEPPEDALASLFSSDINIFQLYGSFACLGLIV